MPFPFDELPVLGDNSQEFTQLCRIHSITLRQRHFRLHPEFRQRAPLADVHVQWLKRIPLIGEKEEAVTL